MQSIEGIILKTRTIEDKELITLFSKELGIIQCIHKVRKNLRHGISPLLKIEALFVPSHKDILSCSSIDVITSYPNARTSLKAISTALRMLQEIMRLLPQKEPHTYVYDLLDQHLHLLSKENDSRTVAASFFLRLFQFEGLLSNELELQGKRILGYSTESFGTQLNSLFWEGENFWEIAKGGT